MANEPMKESMKRNPLRAAWDALRRLLRPRGRTSGSAVEVRIEGIGLQSLLAQNGGAFDAALNRALRQARGPRSCFSREGASDVVCSEENRRRIKVCWEACAGLPTDGLEEGKLGALLYAVQLWATGDNLGEQRTREALRDLGLE